MRMKDEELKRMVDRMVSIGLACRPKVLKEDVDVTARRVKRIARIERRATIQEPTAATNGGKS